MKKLFYLLLIIPSLVFAQEEKEHSPFDFGKMWTFENPPTEWFEEEYGFKADEAWFKDVRMSALKFASWCSASFVSPDGLIMTNHHCSRDEAIKLQQDGENFDNNGYVATTLADERKLDELFVEQLVMVADVTDEVQSASAGITDEGEKAAAEAKAIEGIQVKYGDMEGWEGLRLQVVTFYSGGKYSIYGYKKYSDIRLVFIPENDLGFYGGDPDNFTYPRYNLDCTFWRAYDEDGKPLDTSDNYFKFNPNGAEEGTPVFVVGNPGRTERYRTVAQLEYDRDYRFKQSLRFLTNRRDLMQSQYDEMSQDPSKEGEAQVLLGSINNFSNSIKAYSGIVGGLHNPALMKRKISMEEEIKSKSPGLNYWEDLASEYAKLKPHGWAVTHLAPSPYRGKILQLMHAVAGFDTAAQSGAPDADLAELSSGIEALVSDMDKDDEKTLFALLLDELKADMPSTENFLGDLMGGLSKDAFVDAVMSSDLFDAKKRAKAFGEKKKYQKSKDVLTAAAIKVGARYGEAATKFQSSSPFRRSLEAKIANQAFNVYGTSLPPDATFTLRISDGVVKGYDYNGTVAPAVTTYFGLYDRHYSHGQVFPWALPDRWANPSMDLLRSPMNFVSTNDIIGGNSGSAIINQKGEAVGLIFDGNIESLPGNFIFDEESNRSVSVHAGGIYSALKYVYKAERLVAELDK